MLRGLTLSLTRYRHVLAYLVASDLKVRYRRSVFGYLWTLLEPLSLVFTYYFLFAIIAQVDRPAYPIILMIGVLPWTFFSSVISTGAFVLIGNAGLIQKVYLPRELFMVSQVTYNLVVFLLSLVVVVPMLVWYGIYPDPARLLLLPIAIVLLTLLATGIGMIAACLNVLYRDVGDVLRVLLRLGMYLSPVIYTLDMVPEQFQRYYMLNPISVVLTLFRASLLDEPIPVSGRLIALGIALTLLIFVSGLAVFSRWEAKLIKYL